MSAVDLFDPLAVLAVAAIITVRVNSETIRSQFVSPFKDSESAGAWTRLIAECLKTLNHAGVGLAVLAMIMAGESNHSWILCGERADGTGRTAQAMKTLGWSQSDLARLALQYTLMRAWAELMHILITTLATRQGSTEFMTQLFLSYAQTVLVKRALVQDERYITVLFVLLWAAKDVTHLIPNWRILTSLTLVVIHLTLCVLQSLVAKFACTNEALYYYERITVCLAFHCAVAWYEREAIVSVLAYRPSQTH